MRWAVYIVCAVVIGVGTMELAQPRRLFSDREISMMTNEQLRNAERAPGVTFDDSYAISCCVSSSA